MTTTTAAQTAFCSAKIEGPAGLHLWIDGNGKITAGNGTLDRPRPNAFSLLHIKDCPGATATCKASCYVHGLKAAVPETYALYEHNSVTIRRILALPAPLYFEWVQVFADYVVANCLGGFRWHVSGDIFSAAYADFITATCTQSPQVRHWLYTRTTSVAGRLVHVSTVAGGNLSVNISADADNHAEAAQVADEFGYRLCYLTADGTLPVPMAAGDVIFPDYGLRAGVDAGDRWFAGLSSQDKKIVCPVDYHGKSERRRCGPCDRCLR